MGDHLDHGHYSVLPPWMGLFASRFHLPLFMSFTCFLPETLSVHHPCGWTSIELNLPNVYLGIHLTRCPGLVRLQCSHTFPLCISKPTFVHGFPLNSMGTIVERQIYQVVRTRLVCDHRLHHQFYEGVGLVHFLACFLV